MLSPRQTRLATVRRVNDQHHGEPVRVIPMRAGDQYSRGAPDPAREPFAIVGKLASREEKSAFYQPSDNRDEFDRSPQGDYTLYVDPSVYPQVSMVKKLDVIEAPERAMRFTVQRVDPQVGQRTVLRLSVA